MKPKTAEKRSYIGANVTRNSRPGSLRTPAGTSAGLQRISSAFWLRITWPGGWFGFLPRQGSGNLMPMR